MYKYTYTRYYGQTMAAVRLHYPSIRKYARCAYAPPIPMRKALYVTGCAVDKVHEEYIAVSLKGQTHPVPGLLVPNSRGIAPVARPF